MKVLLDECVDWRFANELPSHDVKTVAQMGWSGTQNGELLSRVETEFTVFVTVDRNLVHQQDISRFQIAVVILRVRSNRLSALQGLGPALRDLLSHGSLT